MHWILTRRVQGGGPADFLWQQRQPAVHLPAMASHLSALHGNKGTLWDGYCDSSVDKSTGSKITKSCKHVTVLETETEMPAIVQTTLLTFYLPMMHIIMHHGLSVSQVDIINTRHYTWFLLLLAVSCGLNCKAFKTIVVSELQDTPL